jgi:UPF0716 protein FxsA
MVRQSGPRGRPGQKGPVFNEFIWVRRWPRLISTGFILLIVLEILAFVWVADKIGLGLTLLALIGSAFLGLWLIRRTGLDMVGRLRLALAQGDEPGHSLIDGACFVVAGLLLILPGFFSDLLALLLMLPVTRNWLIRYVATKMVRAAGGAAGNAAAGATGGPRIISDVEFHEVATPRKSPPPAATPSEATTTGPAAEPEANAPAETQTSTADATAAAEPEILAPIRPVTPEPPAAGPDPVENEGIAEPGEATEDERWGQAPRRPIIDVEES